VYSTPYAASNWKPGTSGFKTGVVPSYAYALSIDAACSSVAFRSAPVISTTPSELA